jgi:hypothetical protein
MFLGDVEGQVEVVQWIIFGQLRVIQQVGAVAVDQSAERETVLNKGISVEFLINIVSSERKTILYKGISVEFLIKIVSSARETVLNKTSSFNIG